MKFRRQLKQSTDSTYHSCKKVITTDNIWLYVIVFLSIIFNSVITVGLIEYLSNQKSIRDTDRAAYNYAQNIKDRLLVSLDDAEKISNSQIEDEIIEISQQSLENYLSKANPGQLARVAVVSQDGSTLASNFKQSSGNSTITSQDVLTKLQRKLGTFSSLDKIERIDLAVKRQHLITQVTPWKNEQLDLNGFLIIAIPKSQFTLNSMVKPDSLLSEHSVYWLPTTVLILLTCIEAFLLKNLVNRANRSQENKIAPQQKAILEAEVSSRQNLISDARDRNEAETSDETSNEEVKTIEAKTIEESDPQAADILQKTSNEAYVLLASMSHELRSPLNSILGFAQIMEQELSTTQLDKENIAIINRSGERMLSIINDVVDLAKIETNRLTLEDNNLDFRAWLDNLEQSLQVQASSQGWDFSLIRQGETPQYICVDERRLRQMVGNIIEYCLKDRSIQNTIVLTVKSFCLIEENNTTEPPGLNNKHDICFEVKNANCSIAAEELATIFNPLTRVKQEQSGARSSLNLPISRKLSQLMGGDITVKALEPLGIVFNLRIQAQSIAAGELLIQPTVRRVIGLESDEIEYRILIVDDSITSRKIMARLLSSVGFQIEEAANGKEAIDVWLRWQPHMIWMDLKMPVMNGCEATERIRSHSSTTRIPIVAFSASTSDKDKTGMKAAGCDDYVPKPFSDDIIFDKIAQHLGIRYRYDPLSEPISFSDSNYFRFKADALSVMPTHWIERVEEAATQLDKDLLTQLLQQIPPEQAELREALQKEVDNFDFDRILNLAVNSHNN